MAIERAAAVEPHIYITLREFPRGACGDASLLLARYLHDSGEKQFAYVLGQRSERSHAWLRRSGLIVDITGDQFSDFPHAVFVNRVSAWHKTFRGKALHVADYEIYDDNTRAMLHSAYLTVSRHLSE